jgi:uncharacterized membrane protein YccC
MSINSRYATQTAIAATFTSALFLYFHYKNPQWAVMSTLLTMQSCANSQCFESTLIAGFNRAIGAIIGIGIGLLGAWLMNLIASDGFLWIILGVVFLALWLAVIINQYCKKLQLIPACTIMVITMSLLDSAPTIAIDRAFEVLAGVCIALVFNFIFCPYKQNKQLERVFHQIVAHTHHYFSHTIGPLTDVASHHKKTTKKQLNAAIDQLHDIKKSRLTFFTTEDMLRQQEQIYNTAELLVNTVFHLQKVVNQTKQHLHDPQYMEAVNTIALIVDQSFRAMEQQQALEAVSLPEINDLYQQSHQQKENALPAIMLLHQLLELYQVIQTIDRLYWYRGSDSNRHGVTTTGF